MLDQPRNKSITTFISKVLSEQPLQFIGFGFFLAFLSSFGQTFYIAIFNGVLTSDLGLSISKLGSLYGAATFVSAIALIGIGKLIDTWDLRVYAVSAIIVVCIACILMANAQGPATLFIALLLLRLGGQGLLSHTAMTSMSRYFHEHRGIAISIANIGFAVGVACFPLFGAKLLVTYGWRHIWFYSALVLICIGLPSILFLLKGHNKRHQAHIQNIIQVEETSTQDEGKGWTRHQVMRDRRFYRLMPLFMALPFIATGIQFNQIVLVLEKNWSLALFASGYIIAAICNIIASMCTGIAISKLGSTQYFIPFFIIPLGISMLLLITSDSTLIIWLYMISNGVSGGIFGVINNTLWAELYGTVHLGAIKSLVMSISIFAAALAPAVMGLLIDSGWTIKAIAVISVIYIGLSMVLARNIQIKFISPTPSC